MTMTVVITSLLCRHMGQIIRNNSLGLAAASACGYDMRGNDITITIVITSQLCRHMGQITRNNSLGLAAASACGSSLTILFTCLRQN